MVISSEVEVADLKIKDCVGGFIVNESSGANFISIHYNLG